MSPIRRILPLSLVAVVAGAALAQDLQVLNLDHNGQFPSLDTKYLDMSGNGHFVVFKSSQLLAGETVGGQIYVRDLFTGALELVSAAAGGGDSDQPAEISIKPNQTMISDDGRYVVFASSASNLLSPPIAGGTRHIYRRDRQLGITELMSVDSAGNPANAGSFDFSLSPDGGVVIFNSTATNLDPLDTDSALNTFVHETGTDMTHLACFDAHGDKITACEDIAISCGGGAMVFKTGADGVAPNDTNGLADLYVGSPLFGNNDLLTKDYNGNPSNAGSHGFASISCDGQRIAFATSFGMTFEDTDGQWDLYVVNRVSAQVWRILDGNLNPVRPSVDVQIASNGAWVVFGTNNAIEPIDTNGFGDFYRLDFRDDNIPGAVTLASQNGGQVANWTNWMPSVSGYGDVAFSSAASNLAGMLDNKGFVDVFAHVEPLFVDSFESGDVSAWSASVGAP